MNKILIAQFREFGNVPTKTHVLVNDIPLRFVASVETGQVPGEVPQCRVTLHMESCNIIDATDLGPPPSRFRELRAWHKARIEPGAIEFLGESKFHEQAVALLDELFMPDDKA